MTYQHTIINTNKYTYNNIIALTQYLQYIQVN